MAIPAMGSVGTTGGAPQGTSGASIPLPAGVTPDYTTISYAYLSARPPVLGIGQTLLVNVWICPGVFVGNYFVGYVVTVTKPDGTTEKITLNSYNGDATSWFEYVPDTIGTYKFKFDFPGGYFPAANYYTNPGAFFGAGTWTNMTQSRYYKPASTPYETNVTVQSEMISSWPPSPLPTDYWTRPVHFENREWSVLLGNYPWSGSGVGYPDWPAGTNHYQAATKYQAWAQASVTSHIVWKRQDNIAGFIGPEGGTDALTSSGSAPGLIYAGRCYQTRTIQFNGVPTSCATCYDLRTGELYYAIPTAQGGMTPTSINYIWGGGLGGMTGEVPGGTQDIGTSVELMVVGTTLYKINPWTGAITANITGCMTGTKIGEFVISIQNIGGGNYRWINWTTRGTSTNFTSRIQENRTYASSSIGGNVDWDAGVWGSLTTLSYQGAPYGVRVMGYDLKTGQLICNFTDTHCPYTTSQTVVDHGKIACLMLDGYFVAYDLRQGKLAWVSTQTYGTGGYPWGIWGAYSSASYGGNAILCEYDGVYAINWDTGKISWVYRDPNVPFETPYTTGSTTGNATGVNPFNTGVSIVDGMIYTYNTEHTQIQPITRGWKFHCINATDGSCVWNITTPMSPGAMADGYTTAGAQDGYMYVFGKGKSATTVTAPQTSVPLGTSFLIQGTVLDKSPAEPNTPCVSKESMTTQMEYLHMQLPIDGIFHNIGMTGVPVSLVAIDANGAVIDLGTVTTNPYYGTFAKEWTPPAEGLYTISASFAGSDAYGVSSAGTSVSVGPATPQITQPTITTETVDNSNVLYAVIGVGIAIILAVAVVGLFLARKR
jgi:hypothetical protein